MGSILMALVRILLFGEAAAVLGLKRLRTGGFWSLLGQPGCGSRDMTGRVWQRPTRSVGSCEDFTRSETGPVPPAQCLTFPPLVVLAVCPSGSLWACWDIPQPVLALNAGRSSWGCSFIPAGGVRPAVLAGPAHLCSAMCPQPISTGWSSRRCPRGTLFTESSPWTCFSLMPKQSEIWKWMQNSICKY